MGVYGYTKKTTPNIDDFTKTSLIFSNAYTIFPTTKASFFALFSGSKKLYKALNSDTSKKSQSLPELFKEKGYITTAFVTNSVIGNKSKYFQKLFDQFHYFYTENSLNTYNDLINEYQNSINLTEGFLSWLKVNNNKKFFTWLHYTNPHAPYNPPHKYLCQIDSDCDSTKYDELEDISNKENWKTISQEHIDLLKNLYDAEILEADEQIGIVIKKLKEYGLDKNSIIVIYGDHGEGFDHDVFEHGDALYESAVKIPLIIYTPLNKKKIISSTLVDNTDIFPSLLDLYGMKKEENRGDGYSFLSTGTFTEKISSQRKYVVMKSSIPNKRAITDGVYKYSDLKGGDCPSMDDQGELYSLLNDKEEKNNIAKSNSAIINSMKAGFQKETSIEVLPKYVLNDCVQNSSPLERMESLGY
jgi:arylsulfatase A-like enzyme